MGPDGHGDGPSGSCCAAGRTAHGAADLGRDQAHDTNQHGAAPTTAGMVRLPGGDFLMGTDEPTFEADGEGPVRPVRLAPFWMDATAVTNERFAAFVHETGFVTEAERFGWSFVFYQFLRDASRPTRGVQAAPWWRQVFGASWQHPEGEGSDLEGREDHPVVHVSWNDAVAYAAWEGKRLPTEAEWEFAARGGLEQARYPWGDRLVPDKRHRCNVWQGTFPTRNTLKDGFAGTAPVDAFEPNGYGLHNMVGNTWEWCGDWFGTEHPVTDVALDPRGPDDGPGKVMKGGSYLCHASYCNRYRVAARTHNTPDSSTGHMGFRLVMDGAGVGT